MNSSSQQLKPQVTSRVPELDGIRGCAIVLVLIWHYGYCQIHHPEQNFLLGAFHSLTTFTWGGVDLFFVLSGFLIGGILLDHKGAPNFFRAFYARRICRIFPLYFLLIGVYVLIVWLGLDMNPRYKWLFDNPMPLWSYLTFTQNFAMGFAGDLGCHFLGVTWSLAIEEQFYLIIPLLVATLSRKALVRVSLSLLVLIPLARLFTDNPVLVFTNIAFRADGLLAGLLLAMLVRNEELMGQVRTYRYFVYVAFISVLVSTLLMQPLLPYQSNAVYSWFTLLSALFMLSTLVDSSSLLARGLRSTFLTWFGGRSYAIYMFHQMVSGIIHGVLGEGVPAIDSVRGMLLTISALGVTLFLANRSFHTYERWFLDYGRRFSYEKSKP